MGIGKSKEKQLCQAAQLGNRELVKSLRRDGASLKAIDSRLQDTHFVSLPLAIHPALVQKISNFQESILASSLGSGIEKSIFVRPATFHLTVLMLKLWNEERVKAAAEVLKGVEAPLHAALDGQPVAVRLLGLACMRGVPSKAHVLYACIEETDQKNRLIAACQVIINAFIEAGLVLEKDSKQSLKLHATVINTIQRKKKKGKFEKLAFDATDIMAKYGSEEWGEYPILEAHLSQRFKYDERGYYHCCCAISFP